LKEIPKTCVVVLVTAEQNARIIKDLLSENRYFGFSDSSFYYCSPPRCYLFEPHSGDFVIGSTGKKLLVSEGSLSALRSVFESGVAEAVLDRGIRYGYVSFLENCGATFDQAIIAMLYLSGKPLLAEVTTWEEDEGPLAVRHRGKNTLLEREQIDDKVYQHLKRNPKLVGGIGTNTYWLNIPEFLAALGLARDDLSEFRVAGQMDRAFQRIGQPLFGTHRCDGRDVIYPDGRLSALTQFIETLYVDVPRTRYVTARRECG